MADEYFVRHQYVVRHYKDGIDVGYIAHPSFVEEEELAAISGPLSIAAAETDPIFPSEKRHKSEGRFSRNGATFSDQSLLRCCSRLCGAW